MIPVTMIKTLQTGSIEDPIAVIMRRAELSRPKIRTTRNARSSLSVDTTCRSNVGTREATVMVTTTKSKMLKAEPQNLQNQLQDIFCQTQIYQSSSSKASKHKFVGRCKCSNRRACNNGGITLLCPYHKQLDEKDNSENYVDNFKRRNKRRIPKLQLEHRCHEVA